MKQNKYISLIGLGIMLTISSCESDFESVPVNQFTIEYVFSDTDSIGQNAQYFLNDLYNYMDNGHNRVDGDYLDAATDDAVTSALSENSIYRLSVGRYSSTNRINADMDWVKYYGAIRKANMFIENIDRVPLMYKFSNNVASNIPMTRAWKAEARFLRAHYHFELVKRYGGVPLITRTMDLQDDMELPRDNFEDCVNFIVKELDEIRDSLRTYWQIDNLSNDAHVVTQEAAMTMKSRVLLYAASPLFNGKTLEASNPLVGYTDYNAERWKLAADAAKYFMDTYKDHYKLAPYFLNIFLGFRGSANPELIFARQAGRNTDIEKKNGPVGFGDQARGDGITSPTQDLVNSFPMLDGKRIGESSKYVYNPLTMYENRDPRLDSTILHNGSQWLNTTIQTHQGAVHNPSGTVQKTKTSYYLRKFMGKFEVGTKYEDQYHLWIMYRYAEILLNYAEAKNEYEGPSEDVYNMLKQLRERAGIEPGNDGMYGLDQNMDKDAMRLAIQNERRIELAFEEHRYWDIRRWRIAEGIFSKPTKGLLITRTAGMLTYNEIDVLNNPFDERRYLYPIPYSEVNKNKNMKQNPKW